MKPIEIEIEIAAEPATVFAAMTDPGRMVRWLPHTEVIEDQAGPIGEAGTTFTQRASPGIRRPGATIAADPPRSWHLRLAGMGERVDAMFRLEERAASTRVRLEARIQNGPAILAPMLNRLGAGLDRKTWSGALERLKAEVERAPAAVQPGSVYSLDSRAGIFRIGQLLSANEGHAHVRLFEQRFTKRPERNDLAELRLGRPGHYAEIQPLGPTLKSAMRGGPSVGWLLADGGFGLAHVPLTRIAFDDAAPTPLFRAGIIEEHVAPVAAWRARNGSAFGETPGPMIGAYFSVFFGTHGYGVTKLLRFEPPGVHVRVYSTIFETRPTVIDEMSLETEPLDPSHVMAGRPSPEPFGMGHLALSHPNFARWQPEFLAMALVDPDELIGYQEWKLAKGSYT